MKTKKTKAKLCLARIDSIGVSKVYNTGNYTNVKYELHAALEPGDDAAAVLKELVYIIQMLRPLYKPDCFDSFTRAIKKTEEEQSAYEKENLPAWRDTIEQYELRKSRRFEAVQSLSDLGGTITRKDAKDEWNEDETPF